VDRQVGPVKTNEAISLSYKLQQFKDAGIDNPCIIYPNPVQNLLYIATKQNKNATYLVQVFDAAGKLVHMQSIKMEAQINSIDVTNLSTANYTIRCVFSNGINFTSKFTKL
jgi:hypothetical protein